MASTQPVRSVTMPKLRQAIKHSARDPEAHRSLNVTGTGGQIDVCSNLDLDCGSFSGFAARRPHESLDARLQQKKMRDELISDSEIEYLIKEKLRREQYAVECMFRNADPTRCGRVHRNALLRILYSICGHIRFEQFHRLLERLGLEDKQTVSFADFRASFAVPDGHQQRRQTSGAVAECDFGSAGPQVGSYSAKPVSVAHAFAMFRQKAAQPGFELSDVLPPACFEPGGVVLKPQLCQALALLRIPLAPGDVDKFWDRFDIQCTGAVSTVQLKALLGLNASKIGELKLSRSKTAPALASRKSAAKAAAAAAKPPSAAAGDTREGDAAEKLETEMANMAEKPLTATPKQQTPSEDTRGDFKYLRRYQQLRKNRPAFDHFVDALHYAFDEPYNALLVTFRHLDSSQTGCVPPSAMQQVLRDFGFPTGSAADFDQFVLRFGLRRGVQGAVSYEELLAKLSGRGCSSLLGRYLVSDRSPLTIGDSHLLDGSGENLSPFQMELQLLRFLHRDYLQLHCGFVRDDPNKTGIISEASFCAALHAVLKSEIPAHQVASLLSQLPRSRNGGIQYQHFLEMFHVAPNSWTKQPPCHTTQSRQQPSPEDSPVPLQLEQPPATLQTPKKPKTASTATKARPVAECTRQRDVLELSQLTQAALSAHFHQVDKMYKQMDRRNTGRMSRTQFWTLLNALGLRLSEEEIGALWDTLDTSADGQWSYRQMLRHFMTDLHEKALERLRASRSWQRADTLDPSVLKLRQLKQLQPRQQQHSEADRPPSSSQETPEPTRAQLDALIDKCRASVVQHWDELKMMLRRLDPQGASFVQRAQFLAMVKDFQLPLSPDEAGALARGFERRANGRFNYMNFLKRFINKSAKPPSQTEELARTVTDKNQGSRVRIAEIMDKIREKLLFEWKSLLLAFRKFDVEKSGHLSVFELRKIVHRCGYSLSEDDLFLLLTEFDLDFDGKINYQEFVMQLLDVAEAA